jgi:hypothetical protein
MDGIKNLLASKTVWGGLAALAAGIVGLFGYSVSPADSAQAIELGTGLASAVGGLVAIVGRVVASKKIG